MKKTFFTLTIVLVSLIAIQSCKKDETKKSSIEELRNKYEIIGKEHNNTLSYVYNDISSHKLTFTSKQEFINIFNEPLIKAVKKSEIIQNSNLEKEKIVNYTNYYYNKPFAINRSEQLPDTLSSKFIELYNQLIDVSNNKNQTINEYFEQINILENEAFNNLTDENEIQIFFIASSVGKSSFNYWMTHIDEWETLFNSSTNKLSDNPYDHPILDGIVGADIGGAVAGALSAAVTGPLGWCAGGILGSSAYSTAKVVENAWNYFME